MTQQPYFPQQPQQGYAPQQPPVQQYPQQPPIAAPPAYGQPAYPPAAYGQPQQPQQPPLAQGTLDDYYSQPTTGSGPAISWKNKPIGASYAGVVARDVTNGDVQQDTDPTTRQPKFYRDGRPQWVMKVPLQQIQTNLQLPVPEFPEGEGSWFVRGQARDELTRAMTEAGVTGAPRQGDVIVVTLVQRRPSRNGGNPANIVQVTYQPAAGHQAAQAAPAAGPGVSTPAPGPVAPQQPVQQPVAPPVAPPVQQQQQLEQPQLSPAFQTPGQAVLPQSPPPAQGQTWPQTAAPAYDPNAAQLQPQQPVQQPVGQPAVQMPAGVTEEQQQILARLTGQQPQA